MGWQSTDDKGNAKEVAGFVRRQVSEGSLTTNWGGDIRQVDQVGDVRGGETVDAYFEVRLASGQYFKVTVTPAD